jgi:putative oxidoreductase
MKKILFGGQELSSISAETGLTLLRIFGGISLALAHGIGKMPPEERFIGFVASIGFPAPAFFAWCASLAELAGGILLALGLLTRPAAFFILFTMAVAFFGVHLHDPYQKKELALLYGFISLAFVLAGSGRISVDAILRRTGVPESSEPERHSP